MPKKGKKQGHIIDAFDVRNIEIGVIAGELDDLSYNVECISHAITALKHLVYYGDMEMTEQSGCAVFDLIQGYAIDRANEIAELSAQVNSLREVGEA